MPRPRQGANKYDAIQGNVTVALEHPDLGERFVYFNDDFYVMEPLDEIPILNGGPPSEYNGKQELKIRMRQTLRALEGRDGILMFDGVHVPLPVIRDLARESLSIAPRGILWRTLYGNLAGMTGTRTPDVKSRDGRVIPGPLMSTNPKGYRVLREYLNDVLPKKSPYV